MPTVAPSLSSLPEFSAPSPVPTATIDQVARLFRAVKQENLSALQQCLDKDPTVALVHWPPDTTDRQRMTALIFAAEQGWAAGIQALLPHSDVNATDGWGHALMHAARRGYTDCLPSLLAVSDHNLEHETHGNALSLVATTGYVACTQLLCAASLEWDPAVVSRALSDTAQFALQLEESPWWSCLDLLASRFPAQAVPVFEAFPLDDRLHLLPRWQCAQERMTLEETLAEQTQELGIQQSPSVVDEEASLLTRPAGRSRTTPRL